MCTSPILIKNKKFVSIGVPFANQSIKVPCGCCEECLRKRAKDLYVRARFEAIQTFKNGGVGFFTTLTYDDNNVPRLVVDGKSFMVFNKRDVILFIKRLRVRLDRFCRKVYGKDAPNFKYLITSEFGTNPTCSHRPHYHCLFLFDSYLSLFTFQKCYKESLFNFKTGKFYFGKIWHCDALDLSKGGIKYTCKYILKDQTYSNQNDLIRKKIKFYSHLVRSKHNLIENPENEDDLFYNKCVRSSKEYRDDVSKYVGYYRNMLQFYMCSNDLGLSCISEVYGDNLLSIGVLDIDGFPYSIPKQVIQYVERSQGSQRKDEIVKSVFVNQFKNCLNDCISRKLIPENEKGLLLDFVANFLQPRFGSLYFVSPYSSFYDINYDVSFYDRLCEEFGFYYDNGFFDLRNKVIYIINLSNSPHNLEFRAQLARSKTCKEREQYEKKKRNKPFNY